MIDKEEMRKFLNGNGLLRESDNIRLYEKVMAREVFKWKAKRALPAAVLFAIIAMVSLVCWREKFPDYLKNETSFTIWYLGMMGMGLYYISLKANVKETDLPELTEIVKKRVFSVMENYNS